MQFKKILFFVSSISLAIILQSVSGGRAAIGGQDRTGSPGALSTTCIACHSTAGSFTNPQLSITVKDNNGAAVNAYTAGETYTLEFQVSSNGTPNGYAMQAVVLDANNNNIGDLTNATTNNTQLSTITNGREFIEHSGRSSTGFFSCSWTAPAAGTGTVSIYGVGMAVNGSSTSGDNTSPSTQFDLTENVSTSINSTSFSSEYSIFPMPNKGNFSLKNNSQAGLVRVVVYNLSGKEFYNNEIYLNSLDVRNIDIPDLNKGLYYVQISNQNNTQSLPLIIK